MKNRVVCVVGPTASGKTRLAVTLAQSFNGEVVSADSMQLYRGMDICTAKPDETEKGGIPHHMLDIASPSEYYSAQRYADEAGLCVEDIIKRGRLPIIAGGTGLYIHALIDGFNITAPEADAKYREKLEEIAASEGGEALHRLLEKNDPETAARLHQNDRKRIIRALEIYKTTGKTMAENMSAPAAEPKYNALMLGLRYADREELYSRIEIRVDDMLAHGLLEEARLLLSSGVPKNATAMQAIGYKELSDYIGGTGSLSEAVEKIKRESRRYAKRQITWFSKDKRIKWLETGRGRDFSEIISEAGEYLRRYLL